jgi:hypothetical protein
LVDGFHGLVDALAESFSTSWVLLRLRLGCWKMGTAPGAPRISWCVACWVRDVFATVVKSS